VKRAKRSFVGVLLCLFLILPVWAASDEALPNDPLYGQQWALEAIDWLPVWQQGLTGKGVKIGIIDSGANIEHEDLQGAKIQGYSFTSSGLDAKESFANDQIGHGTFVTGVIAAQPNNGMGIVGIAPDAEIYAYRAFSNKEGSVESVLHAIDQAIADGCRILNLSMGATKDFPELKQGIEKAQQAGMLVVCAVGNGSPSLSTIMYPAAYEGVIGVGAVNPQMERASFSQINDTVFVVAPGQDLQGLKHNDDTGYKNDRGTSFAAPMVTAVMALALEYDPTLTPEELTEMLRITATDLGDPGYDTSYGYGLINAAAFVESFQSHFSVHYQFTEDTCLQDIVQFYPIAQGASQLIVPACKGHTFAGWYEDLERTKPVEQFAAGTTDRQLLYAKWEPDGQGQCSDKLGDGDHACDICSAPCVSSCTDLGRDHICDECDLPVGNHAAAEGTHICDYCGEIMNACADADKNHVCDICGSTMGNHVAAEGTHICDYCGEIMNACADADKNHVCDICGSTMGNHAAAEGTHICDYCGEIMNACADADKNHVCDICGSTMGNHVAAEGTHICAYCGQAVSTCADGEDGDILCDICGQKLLKIYVESGFLVVENKTDIQLIIAEYDAFGKLIGVQIVTEGASVPIRGQTRAFIFDQNFVPQLPWVEANTDFAAAQ